MRKGIDCAAVREALAWENAWPECVDVDPAVKSHLAACARCRRVARELGAFVGSDRERELLDGFADRVMARIDRRTPSVTSSPGAYRGIPIVDLSGELHPSTPRAMALAGLARTIARSAPQDSGRITGNAAHGAAKPSHAPALALARSASRALAYAGAAALVLLALVPSAV